MGLFNSLRKRLKKRSIRNKKRKAYDKGIKKELETEYREQLLIARKREIKNLADRKARAEFEIQEKPSLSKTIKEMFGEGQAQQKPPRVIERVRYIEIVKNNNTNKTLQPRKEQERAGFEIFKIPKIQNG